MSVHLIALGLLLLDVDPPAPALLSPKVGIFVWTMIVFLPVLFILWKYAWKPISVALVTREQTIASSIERAELALAEARQIAADNETARREAEGDARRIIGEARTAAEVVREEETEKTRTEIRLLQAQAQAEIEQEKQSALNALRAEVADLAIQAAEKILREKLDAGSNRKLVEGFIDGLPKN